MLDFTINYQDFLILFGSYTAFLAFVFGISHAITFIKKELN